MATDSLRSLVVSLEAKIDKFESNMKVAADTTNRTMKGIENSLASAKSHFLGLAASVLSVGAALQSVKGAIQLGDDLKQMADSTGIAVAKLDELSIIAKLNGTNLDGMATGFKGLRKAIVEAQDATSKQSQLFSALGVAVKDSAGNLRGVDEVMVDVAKALNSIENETTRAAVGTALFGKSYQQIAATLRNFEADQKIANETLERFGRVSQFSANMADEFGDRLTVLGEGGKRALLDTLTPGLAAANVALEALTKEAGGATRAMGDLFSAIIEGTAKAIVSTTSWFKITGESIGAYFAGLVTQSNVPAEEFARRMEAMRVEAERTKTAIESAANRAKNMASDTEFGDLEGAMARAAASAGTLGVNSKKLNDILGGEGKAKIADYADEMAKLRAEMDKLAGADGGYARLSSAELRIASDRRAGKIVSEEQAQAFRALARAADDLELEIKRVAAAWEAYENGAKAALAFQQQLDDAMFRANLAIKAQNDALDLEHATLGLTDNARQVRITTLALEKAQIEGNTNAIELLTQQLDKLGRQAADNSLLQMAEQARQAFEAATAFASDFFVDLFNNGSRAFKNLWENFKQLAFRALADIAAKQVVVSIVGSVSAGAAGTASAGGGAGGLLGGLGNLLSGGFGGGGGLLGATGFGGAQTAALDSALITHGFQALAGGAMTSILGPVVAALPFAGIAAVAIPLIGRLFGSNKPPREGGFAESGVDVDRFVRQSQFDNALEQSTDAMVASFARLNAALGGTLAGGFAQGIEGRRGRDKEGTTAAFVGGQEVFRSSGVSLGKDEAAIQAALQLESKRAILAALQASDIASRFAEILNSVTAAAASSADVDRVLSLAQSLQAVEVILGPLNTGLGATGLAAAEAAQQLIDAAGGADQFASQVAAYNQTFMTAGEQLDAAFAAVSDSFVSISQTMPTSLAGFRDLVESLDLTTTAGRATFSALMDVAPAFASVTNAVNDMINNIYSLQDSIHGVSDGGLRQLNTAIAAFVSAVPGFAPVLQQLGSQGFAANLANIVPSDLANYSPSNIGLIQAVLTAYNNLLQSAGSGGGGGGYTPSPSTGPSGPSWEDMLEQAQSEVDALLRSFAEISNMSTGDFGEKLSLQLRLVLGSLTNATQLQLPLLQTAAANFNRQLTLFDSLRTRYSASISEQLVKLTAYYDEQATMLAGNVAGLDVLNQIFEEQWNAIIAGTAAGVDGTMDELRRLQQGILDYVDSLKIGALSPLTPLQQLSEAQRQYQSTLSSAQTGDRGALGDITGSADAFLTLARDFYASSATYTELFNRITGELTALGTSQMAAADFENAAEYLANAQGASLLSPPSATGEPAWQTGRMPATPLADPAVVDGLAEQIAAAVYEAALMIARAGAEDADGIKGEIDRSKLAIVEAITVGLK